MTRATFLIFLLSASILSCGKKNGSNDVQIEVVPTNSALINAAKLSSCTDIFNHAENPGDDLAQSIQNQWVAIFNFFTITYTPPSTSHDLDWWNIRIVFEGSQIEGDKFTCNFSDEFDALVSDLTRHPTKTNPNWGTANSDGTVTYQTGKLCRVICKGLTVKQAYRNQKLTINGTLKISAYAFASEDDGQPDLLTSSTPIQVSYEGEED